MTRKTGHWRVSARWMGGWLDGWDVKNCSLFGLHDFCCGCCAAAGRRRSHAAFALGDWGATRGGGKHAIADGRWQTRCKQDGGGMPAHPPRLFDEPTWARLRWTSLLRAIKGNLGTCVIA